MKTDNGIDVIPDPDRKIILGRNQLAFGNPAKPFPEKLSHIAQVDNVLGLSVHFADKAPSLQQEGQKNNKGDSCEKKRIFPKISSCCFFQLTLPPQSRTVCLSLTYLSCSRH